MTREPSDKRPTWWLLYTIGVLLVGLLALLETYAAGGLRGVLQIVVVVASFALMSLWRRHNRVALELDEWNRRRGALRRHRVVNHGDPPLGALRERRPDPAFDPRGRRALHYGRGGGTT